MQETDEDSRANLERRLRAIDSAIRREQMKLGVVQSVANLLMKSMRRLRGESLELDIDSVVRRCFLKWRKRVRTWCRRRMGDVPPSADYGQINN